MNSVTPSVSYVLNNLIETCKDEQESFRAAAEDVNDPELRSLFNEFSRRREEFAEELRNCASTVGDFPRGALDTMGVLHRSWIHFRIALARGDQHAILEECERGEDGALDEYRRALARELPEPVASIVERQYHELQTACEQVHHLCHITARKEKALDGLDEQTGVDEQTEEQDLPVTAGGMRMHPTTLPEFV
jgi:uncharacterized protein (TIGR02284 family)